MAGVMINLLVLGDGRIFPVCTSALLPYALHSLVSRKTRGVFPSHIPPVTVLSDVLVF